MTYILDYREKRTQSKNRTYKDKEEIKYNIYTMERSRVIASVECNYWVSRGHRRFKFKANGAGKLSHHLLIDWEARIHCWNSENHLNARKEYEGERAWNKIILRRISTVIL